MTENTKNEEIPLKLVRNPQEFMKSFKTNFEILIGKKGYKLKDAAELADVNYETLKSFLYGDVHDCKLSTAIKLAKLFNISIDELVGCGTISEELQASLSIARELPENYMYFIHWGIRYFNQMLKENRVTRKAINVIMPELDLLGNVKITSNFELMDIGDIPDALRQRIFMGIYMIVDYYMPIYSPYDIILIANDRKPMSHEKSVIVKKGILWACNIKTDPDGKTRYYSIRDGKCRGEYEEGDEVLGYIAKVIHKKS